MGKLLCEKNFGTFGVEMRAYGQKLVKFCTHTHTRLSYSSRFIEMIWLKNYQNNIYTTSSLAATSLCFNRSKKWVINTRPGDLGSKTAKQLYNSYQICSDHFEDSQYMDPAHTSLMPHAISIDFYMKAETIKLYWNRPGFALVDHVWKQHVVVPSPSGGL